MNMKPQMPGNVRRRKSRYVTLLMVGVATSLVACDQHDMTQDSTIYGDVETCSKERSAEECTQAFEDAKTAHVREAPKFTTREECEAAGYSQCEIAPSTSTTTNTATNTNETPAAPTTAGGGGGMFMPMMMGYMMGRMLGGGGMGGMGAPPPGQQQPNSQPGSRDVRASGAGGAAGAASRPVYSDRAGYLYTDGKSVGRVAPGTTSLRNTSVAANSVARGGFGGNARSYSAGS
jgi:uncharacterized protein YgiB involved in biofilm formation